MSVQRVPLEGSLRHLRAKNVGRYFGVKNVNKFTVFIFTLYINIIFPWVGTPWERPLRKKSSFYSVILPPGIRLGRGSLFCEAREAHEAVPIRGATFVLLMR